MTESSFPLPLSSAEGEGEQEGGRRQAVLVAAG